MNRGDAPSTRRPTDPCAFCGVNLLAEVLRLAIVAQDGECWACPSCTREVLRRLEQADAEAGELLESWWSER